MTKQMPKRKMTKENCIGCEQDFYNGNNTFGITGCWNFKSAELVMRKKVHIDQIPPWKQKAQLYPSCYQIRKYVFVKENQEC